MACPIFMTLKEQYIIKLWGYNKILQGGFIEKHSSVLMHPCQWLKHPAFETKLFWQLTLHVRLVRLIASTTIIKRAATSSTIPMLRPTCYSLLVKLIKHVMHKHLVLISTHSRNSRYIEVRYRSQIRTPRTAAESRPENLRGYDDHILQLDASVSSDCNLVATDYTR